MKIILACGGTGGHIFPAIGVAEEMLRRRPETRIVFVGGRLDIEESIFRQNVPHRQWVRITSACFRGRLSLCDPVFLLKCAVGFLESLWILTAGGRPDLVVGFGGYFSFPMVLAARLLGIRTMIHEQNVWPGKANRVLARRVDGLALSFADTSRWLVSSRARVRVTGNPIRACIERECRLEALRFFDFEPFRRTLLVLGGSQGADSINQLFFEAAQWFGPQWKQSTQVLHLCGRMSAEEAENQLKQAGIGHCRAFSFFDKMDLAYGAADFCLGRAGATFLAEIKAKRLPAILIPYPYGDGHQRANAERFYRERSAPCLVVEQKVLSGKVLGEILETFSGDLSDASAAPRVFLQGGDNENARQKLADFMMELAG